MSARNVRVEAWQSKGRICGFFNAAEANPENMEAQLALGKILLLARQPDKALEKSEIVIAKDQKNEDALILKGKALAASNQKDKAMAHFEGL